MTRRSFLMLGLGLALALSAVARADSWPPPRPRVFAEPLQGRYAFKSLPGSGEGVLFTLDTDGKEQVMWRAALVNVPHRVIVGRSGKHVVTLDSWGRFGGEHALVVYGEKGKVLADFKLEDLLTKKEIEGLPNLFNSGLRWTQYAEFEEQGTDPELVVRMKYEDWSKTFRVSLNTGKLAKE